MRTRVIPGGIAAMLVATVGMLVASCGLDVTGALDPSTEDAGGPPIDAAFDRTAARDGNGGRDTSGNDVVVADAPADGFTQPDTPPPPTDAGLDAPDAPAVDAGLDAPVVVDTGVDAPIDVYDAGCTTADGCFILPGGWNVVAFTPTAGTACPTSFTKNPRDVDEGALTPGAGACTCDNCTEAGAITCTKGPIGVDFDADGSKSCGARFTALQNANNGGCNTDNFHGAITSQYDVSFTPPAAQGGSCNVTTAKHPDKIAAAARDRLCDPDDATAGGCNGNECTPMPAAPFLGCIEHPGDQACPAGTGLNTKHLVGDSVSFSCSTCACSIAATCTNETVTYYTDNACKMGALPMVADGTCNSQGGTGASYGSYQYTATVNVTCSGGTSQASNVALTGLHTVCCRP